MPNYFILYDYELLSDHNTIFALATNIQGDKWPGSTVGLVHCVIDILETYTGSHRKLLFRKERGHQKEHEPYAHCPHLQYNTGFAMSHESWLTKWSTCSSSCTYCSCNALKFLPYKKHCFIPAEDGDKIKLCILKIHCEVIYCSIALMGSAWPGIIAWRQSYWISSM